MDDGTLKPSESGKVRPADLNLTRLRDLTHLRYFVAVAEELHFGRAAARLGMSQPPLTTQIQALEQQVGAKLFTRTNRKVSLTGAGRMLLTHATQLLRHAERVGHVMQGLRTGEVGNLFLGCIPFGIFTVLPAITRRFREAHPGINLVITEGHTADILREVSEDRLDVGLVWKNLTAPDLGNHIVLEGKFVAALPTGHRLLGQEVVSLADLALEPLILPSRKISPYHFDQLLAAFTRKGLIPRIDYEVPLILSQLGYAASGFGIAIVPSFARRFIGLNVEFREINEPMPPAQLSLVWNERQWPNAVAHLIEVVKALHVELNEAFPPPGAAPA